MNMNLKQQGFNLIELLITVSIIGILTSIALPSYGRHVTKTKVMAALTDASIYKTEVILCYQSSNNFNGCNAGTGTIPDISGRVKSVTNGKITVDVGTSCNNGAINSEIILEPSNQGALINWFIVTDNDGCQHYIPHYNKNDLLGTIDVT